MYTALHCRVNCALKINNIIEGLKMISGPFSQSRSPMVASQHIYMYIVDTSQVHNLVKTMWSMAYE